MRINILEIGTEIVLSQPWDFDFYAEMRNKGLGKVLKVYDPNTYHWTLPLYQSSKVVLPSGTILKVDRIYIRKGRANFSSVTFWAKLPSEKNSVRFWAKLSDVNNIEYING